MFVRRAPDDVSETAGRYSSPGPPSDSNRMTNTIQQRIAERNDRVIDGQHLPPSPKSGIAAVMEENWMLNVCTPGVLDEEETLP